MTDLALLLGMGRDGMALGLAVFLRVGAAMALLPAFGEKSVPARVRLGLGLAFTLIVAPAVAGTLAPAVARPADYPSLWITEPLIGLAFGVSLRLAVMVLHITGTIIAQSISLSQAFATAGAEPTPVVGEILVMAALALAVTFGLHLRVAEALVETYQLFPPGSWPTGSELLTWGIGRIASSFALGFSLAMPFVIGALIYNVALGVINKAMPQLMVAMVGAPALTLGGMVLLILVAPAILTMWIRTMGDLLLAPL
jgi:flagellar biosynthetic protein FliR